MKMGICKLCRADFPRFSQSRGRNPRCMLSSLWACVEATWRHHPNMFLTYSTLSTRIFNFTSSTALHHAAILLRTRMQGDAMLYIYLKYGSPPAKTHSPIKFTGICNVSGIFWGIEESQKSTSQRKKTNNPKYRENQQTQKNKKVTQKSKRTASLEILHPWCVFFHLASQWCFWYDSIICSSYAILVLPNFDKHFYLIGIRFGRSSHGTRSALLSRNEEELQTLSPSEVLTVALYSLHLSYTIYVFLHIRIIFSFIHLFIVYFLSCLSFIVFFFLKLFLIHCFSSLIIVFSF